MREKLRKLYSDSLLQNSFYLMLTTGTMAVLGFLFWLICARLFTPEEIGVATSLISAMTLISYISLLGFNSTFIRILPTSTNKDNEINTGLVLSISLAVVLATAYVFAVPYITPRLGIINENFFYAIGFIAMVALAAINLLTDSIFIAYRGAKYNLLIDGGIMGTVKMFLPFAFVGLGAYGVFAASGAAASVAMIASIFFLVWKFGYKPRLTVHWDTLKTFFHYLSANYIANLFNIAPTLILPLVVINRLGSAAAGYYYLAFMVANLLYAVIYSVSQALFAEGSYETVMMQKLFTRSAIIIAAIMIPAGFIMAAFGPIILEVFGKSYGVQAGQLIIVLALASPLVAAYVLGNVLLRINNQVYSIITSNIVYAVAVSGLAVYWAGRGLVWIGVAWMVGNFLSAVVAFVSVIYFTRRARAARATS